MNPGQGLVVVEELLPVEGIILLLGHVLLCPLPQGDHGVQGLHLGIGLILRLVLRGTLLHPGLGDLHADGIADIVGILADQATQTVLFQKFRVIVLLGVLFQGHNNVGAGLCLGTLRNGVAVSAVGDPLPAGLLAVLAGDDGDGGSHHEGRVEANTKLADDVDVLLLFHSLLEAQGAGLGDGAQVLFHVLSGHADAVVGNGQDPVFCIRGNGDGKLIPIQAHLVIGQGSISQLVNGIRGVGDNFPKEDLPMGINRVDHQIQQPLGFCFELLFSHSVISILSLLALVSLEC